MAGSSYSFLFHMRDTKPISASVQLALSELLAELQAKSGCEKIGLPPESFAAILGDVAAKYLPAGCSQTEARAFHMRDTKPISASVQLALSELLAELQAKSGCEKIGLPPESFAAILGDVAAKYLRQRI